MKRIRTVLVTGSLGYIGSYLTPYLAAHGFRCVGYDIGFFQDCTLFPPQDPPTRLADARAFREEDLDGIDAVVHLAGISNDPLGMLPADRLYDPTRDYAVRIARLCKERGVQFLFASSCSVYGVGRDELVTEASEAVPQTPYSLNKLQIESDLQAISDERFTPVILRFATVFGLSARMRFDLVVNMFVGMALTTGRIILNSNGKAWRPHVHIEDVCQAIRCCLEHPPHANEALVLNVGETQQNLQIIEVAEMVKAKVPRCELVFLNALDPSRERDLELVRDRKIQDGVDTRTYKVAFNQIEHTLRGFRCRWSAERGVEAMIRDLRTLGLTHAQVNDPRFYRLQRFEALMQAGELTRDLHWTRRAPLVTAELSVRQG